MCCSALQSRQPKQSNFVLAWFVPVQASLHQIAPMSPTPQTGAKTVDCQFHLVKLCLWVLEAVADASVARAWNVVQTCTA